MKTLIAFTAMILSPALAYSQQEPPFSLQPPLNTVILPLHAEGWVTTKTALVNVTVNATLSDRGIELIQDEVMKKLNDISDKAEWHVITFQRDQDKSGLESVQMIAEARLTPSSLAHIRSKSKSMSKPGETYTISRVDFTPSNDEIEQVKTTLRDNIYQQVKAEVSRLNQVYPAQPFIVHDIDFVMEPPLVMPLARNMAMSQEMVVGGAVREPNLSVANKLSLDARVTLSNSTK